MRSVCCSRDHLYDDTGFDNLPTFRCVATDLTTPSGHPEGDPFPVRSGPSLSLFIIEIRDTDVTANEMPTGHRTVHDKLTS
jgi:hypothetical protein